MTRKKISCNVKKGTSLVKNSSQTVEIKDNKCHICEQKVFFSKEDALFHKKAMTNSGEDNEQYLAMWKQGIFFSEE